MCQWPRLDAGGLAGADQHVAARLGAVREHGHDLAAFVAGRRRRRLQAAAARRGRRPVRGTCRPGHPCRRPGRRRERPRGTQRPPYRRDVGPPALPALRIESPGILRITLRTRAARANTSDRPYWHRAFHLVTASAVPGGLPCATAKASWGRALIPCAVPESRVWA